MNNCLNIVFFDPIKYFISVSIVTFKTNKQISTLQDNLDSLSNTVQGFVTEVRAQEKARQEAERKKTELPKAPKQLQAHEAFTQPDLTVHAIIPGRASFVGAHPIAGGEKSGFRVSSDTLYEGARCIVTPTDQTDPSALKRVIKLWETVGMRVSIMNIKEHDFIFGAVSHLPHVLIFALMNTIGSLKSDNYDGITSFSGAGLKDITRIAGSEPGMGRDICISNKSSVLYCLDQFQETLNHLRMDIEQENRESLTREFEVANKHRLNLIENA